MKRNIFLITILSLFMINLHCSSSSELLKHASLVSAGAALAGMGFLNTSGPNSSLAIWLCIAGSALSGHYFPQLMTSFNTYIQASSNVSGTITVSDLAEKSILASSVLSGTGIYLKHIMPLISDSQLKVAGIAGSVIASSVAGELIVSGIKGFDSIKVELKKAIASATRSIEKSNGFYFGTGIGTAITCALLFYKSPVNIAKATLG